MKSFIISVIITIILFGSFMQIFEPKPKGLFTIIPEWLFFIFLGICIIGYCAALFWGVKEIARQHALLNLIGIGLSIFGLGCFALAFVMSGGKGKEKPGQFAHEYNQIAVHQRAALDSLMKETGTKPSQVQMVAYWKMSKNPDHFVICVQDSNVIALQIKNATMKDLHSVAKLPHLSWLILDDCGLTTLEDLDNPRLERLNVNNNKLVSLNGLEHASGIKWLDFSNNPIGDSSALKYVQLY